ncbi:hypothetical protein TVAG_183020 [Trichomonas vaginalis G3]|uniref:Uncharacterized protein n=1 Tax=Trichomonas vaginalis (strain ATCC PRA-98 / G3) TaxID=412133 RepID=A2D940_TRIV3|nr:hypothetical protein TVAGG3_0529620 [Trichomonas vaginalis G3]EAY23066.1 hypothetical protein TVAG_183020 [Trichomonas vaginalis G3]KAI5519034.1 hypothetical protein TVAGG3_0529620 [Trichomonas vaginalis G3]|eukprot:XP_001584052.1 hypothetical protein [Trichomonas vaginalis G3]
MNHAAERLANVAQIRRLLADLERLGLWKSTNITDQGTIDGTKDEIIRILNLVETELERAGLWDRSIDTDDSSTDVDQNRMRSPPVTNEQILQHTQKALKCISQKKNQK